jgi:hypothetical protein
VFETKFWVTPELFVIPVPLMVNFFGQVIVNELAPELKTIAATWIAPESEMLVILEVLKVAVSEGPLGTVFGVQFAAVFQSPLTGFRFHVALPAKTAVSAPSKSVSIMAQDTAGDFMARIMPIAGLKSKADS